jgi:RNA recognition motif-containing protein
LGYLIFCNYFIAVKIIMDRISKRSKGYAFIEYTTEEAGGAALKAMNGEVPEKAMFVDRLYMASIYLLSSRLYFYVQIINGWMIVVDVAKTKSRDRHTPSGASSFRPHFHTR